LPAMQQDEELVDFCEISPELSRPFRGLRVWLPLKMFGVDVFRKQLDEKLDLTAWATEELRKIVGMEIVAEPQLSVVAFRYAPAGQGDLNALNRELLERINGRKHVMMTPTTLGGQFVIRICVVSFRTHLDRMQVAVDDVRESVRELAIERLEIRD
ncbi:MAG: pyridoxal-dependent decarboxylase, partial [Thermoanaerobaculia bacterium]